ncbi:MAG TPA: hypothetical protein VIS72_08500 [Anaerolineales bacterium]
MSKNKKYKKQRRKEFPLPLVVFGGILLIFAAILYARQGGGGTPSIAVDQQRIDYGDVKFNDPKTFAIKITNTGDGTLRFQEEPYIQVMEGC